MQEKSFLTGYASMINISPTHTRRGDHSVIIDGVITAGWTLILGIPLFVIFLILVYYELFLHGVLVSFSVLHILGKVVPLHLATLLLWSSVFWTAAFSIRRFLDKKRQLNNTREWLRASHTQVYTDALTGVLNRRGFDELFNRGIEQTRIQKRPYTLLLADVNQFKHFNDTHGHLAGDQALQQIAHILMDAVRTGDAVARYGGDEFALLCPGSGRKDAAALIERIHFSCREKTQLTLSIGTAVYPLDGDCITNLIQRADDRMYRAKNF